MSTIPNEERCIGILRSMNVPDRVIKHTCTVTILAQAIGRQCNANMELVTAGALLHDIGRTRTHGIRHAVEGAEIARSIGLPEPVALIIQKHLGAGLTPYEAAEVGLPPLNYMPSTLEEKIVCHADNLVADATYMTSQESFRDFIRKGYERTGLRMLEMHRALSAKCGEDIDNIVLKARNAEHRGPCSKYLDMTITKWMG